jgi:TonB-linked SusC/RagA family outer membrane protein
MKRYLLLFIALLSSSTIFAQSIRGKIMDVAKEPVVGAGVVIEGTSIATVTDALGNFSIGKLQANTKYKLKISMLGFQTINREVQTSTGDLSLTFTLREDSKQLEDVVVVGYGTKTRREVTGSISRISAKELNDLPVQSFESALQAKLPGVQVTTGSGLAGSASKVNIRGISSISAGGDPLYVVDGIPITQDYFLLGNNGGMNQNPLAAINPDDIESIDVLKDAAANAIYGSRGSNGVILITTKKAKKGLEISYTGSVGTSQPTALPNMLNSEQFLQIYQEAHENDGGVGLAALPGGISWDDARKTNTNWVDLMTQTGIKNSHNISIAKGSNKFSILGNLSYSNNESYLVGNSYNRTSARVNADYRINKNLKLNLNSSLSRGVNNRVNAAWSGGLGSAMSTALPIYPVYNPDGTLWRGGDNPMIAQLHKKWMTAENRSINGAQIEYTFNDQLKFNLNGNLDYMHINDDVYQDKEFDNAQHAGYASRGVTTVKNYNYFFQTTYDVKMPLKHKLKLMGGYEYQRAKTNSKNFNATNMSDGFYNPDAKIEDSILYSYNFNRIPVNEWKFNSVFARTSYSYKDKIYVEATFRVDGSSRFGKNYAFGYFPAFSASYLLTEEGFMANLPYISMLKIRGSIGKSGNANIPERARFYTAAISNTGYNGLPYVFPDQFGNDDLRWESSWTKNIGLDAGILNDRIILTAEYYVRNTNDVLMNLTPPASTGISNYYANVGAILNRGVEFSFTSRNLVNELKWSTTFNIAKNYNEVTSTGLYSSDAVGGGTNDTRVEVGSPVGTNYLVRFSRIDAATGRPVYFDINGNETFTWDPINRVVAGDVLPEAIGGITNSFQYKNWDLSFLINFVLGGDIYESSAKRQLGVVTNWNMRTDIFDRWQKPGDNAAFPILTLDNATYGSGTPWINTTMWLHDGTFARLRNVTIAYRVPSTYLKKLKISSARISFIGTNLLTLTKYPGLDPEIARDFENATDRNMSPNITYLTPPQEKTYSMQVSITF